MKGLLFTYLLAYGGAVAGVLNPYYGVLAYVCLSIVKPEFLWHWAVPAGNYSRTVAIALLVGWSMRGFGSWKLGRAGLVVALLIGYWGWSALGASVAENQEVAWGFVDYLTKIVLPFLVGITVIDSVQRLEWLAWTIVLSLGYVAFDFNQSYLSGFNRILWAGFFGGDNNCAALGLVSGVWLAFFTGLGSGSRWIRTMALASAALIAHAIFFSFSRGAMLGLAGSGLVAFLIMPKSPKHWIAAVAALLICLRMAGPDVREEFLTAFVSGEERDSSAESRVTYWSRCLESMAAEPILGIGPDHWPLVSKERWGKGMEAHTLWLQIGAELGLPGLALLAAFYGVCLVRALPYAAGRRCPEDPRVRYLAQGVVASLVGFAISAQFVSLEQLEIPYYLVLIGAGLLKLTSTPAVSIPGQGDYWTSPGVPSASAT